MKVIAVLFSLTLSLAAQAQTLVHEYDFNGNLNDSVGNSPLVNNGGTVGAGVFSFGPNQGPSFYGASTLSSNYSIAIEFSLSSVTGFKKVIDFKNLGSDNGQYIYGGKVDFYPNSSVGSFDANQTAELIFTRDAATKNYTAYENGSVVYTFTDSNDYGVATIVAGGYSLFNFFIDDTLTGGRESTSGQIDLIKIWDGPISPSMATTVFTAPEPSTLALAAVGTLVGGFRLSRRNRK